MDKLKRILAVICIVILVGLYVTTFFMAVFDSTATMSMFKGCVICTVFVPVVAYLYLCLHRYAVNYFDRLRDEGTPSSADDNASSDDKQ
jgi:hypothetical protein